MLLKLEGIRDTYGDKELEAQNNVNLHRTFDPLIVGFEITVTLTSNPSPYSVQCFIYTCNPHGSKIMID